MTPAIGGPKVLQAMDGNGPLTDLGLVVTGLPLARLVGVSGELAGEHDVTISPPRWCGTWGLAHVSEFEEHGIGVVHRHNPAVHHGTTEGMLLVAIFPDRGHLLQVRQDVFDHARPDIVPHAAGRRGYSCQQGSP